MAAHVFIVTPETFPIVRDRGIAAIVSEDVTKKRKPIFVKYTIDNNIIKLEITNY